MGGRKKAKLEELCNLIENSLHSYLQISCFAFIYHAYRGFPGGSVVKNPSANTGDVGSIHGLGRCPGGGNGNPLWYSCLGNPTDRRAWQVIVHGVAKCQTRLSIHKYACNIKERKSFALKMKNYFVT